MFFLRTNTQERERVIIVGAGEVGFNLALRLSAEKKSVVVMDVNQDALRRFEDQIDVQIIHGSGTNPETLKKAGVFDAVHMLAVTDDDSVNVLACALTRALTNKPITVARVRQADFIANTDILTGSVLNISCLVNPDYEIVRLIDRLLSLPAAQEYGEYAKGRIRVMGILVEDGPFLDQPLSQFRSITNDPGILVGSIVRGNQLIVPSGQDVILRGDVVFFVYLEKSQDHLFACLKRARSVLGSVTIVGAGDIGLTLAKRLEQKNIRVKLMDNDAARCAVASELLTNALVLHSDGTDKHMLEEEKVGASDVLIAVTDDDETNILSCLLAKSLGVKSTVARVNKSAYLPLLHNIGIDHSVSPRIAAVNSILQNIRKGGIVSSLPVSGTGAEVLEVPIDRLSPLSGRMVKDLGLPKKALLLGIIRGEEPFIPDGNSIVLKDDHLIILTDKSVRLTVEHLLATRIREE